MTAVQWAWLATALWMGWLILFVVRFRLSQHLNQYAPVTAPDAPLVSVIVPARNEAHNIGRCLGALLNSRYPNLEIIVVDDHSTDDTGTIARTFAASDARGRARVLEAPPLPEGWFGKQWACHTGAAAARGSLLLFTDADTFHGPELHARSVAAMQARKVHLFTVAGRQEMETFWEKVIQPFVFALILVRFNGLEAMNRSTRPRNKIANGQFILMERAVYDAIGGHEATRAHVAEDLMLAQRATAAGYRVHMLFAREHLSTRMYTNFADIRRGWRKNLFAAGRDTMPPGVLMELAVRIGAPLVPVLGLWPWVGVGMALCGAAPAALLAPFLVALAATLILWMGIYGYAGHGLWWAVTYPLGAVVVSAIFAEAAWRGDRVEWKGRDYVSQRG